MLRCAHLGSERADEMEPTMDEQMGYMAAADGLQALWHMRDAWSEKPRG